MASRTTKEMRNKYNNSEKGKKAISRYRLNTTIRLFEQARRDLAESDDITNEMDIETVNMIIKNLKEAKDEAKKAGLI